MSTSTSKYRLDPLESSLRSDYLSVGHGSPSYLYAGDSAQTKCHTIGDCVFAADVCLLRVIGNMIWLMRQTHLLVLQSYVLLVCEKTWPQKCVSYTDECQNYSPFLFKRLDVNNPTRRKLTKINYIWKKRVRIDCAVFYLRTSKQLFSNTCRTL